MEQLELISEEDLRLLNTKVMVWDKQGRLLTEGVHYTRDGYNITPAEGIEIYKSAFHQKNQKRGWR